MKIKYEQSFRDDIPGNIVVDHEDGSELVIIPCHLADAPDVMAAYVRDQSTEDLFDAEGGDQAPE